MRLARWGGFLGIAVSSLLLVSLVARGVELNILSGWTIMMGIAGGVVALKAVSRLSLLVAGMSFVLAMLPAMIGGVGFLYVPSLVLVVAPAIGAGARSQ